MIPLGLISIPLITSRNLFKALSKSCSFTYQVISFFSRVGTSVKVNGTVASRSTLRPHSTNRWNGNSGSCAVKGLLLLLHTRLKSKLIISGDISHTVKCHLIKPRVLPDIPTKTRFSNTRHYIKKIFRFTWFIIFLWFRENNLIWCNIEFFLALFKVITVSLRVIDTNWRFVYGERQKSNNLKLNFISSICDSVLISGAFQKKYL